MILTIMYLGDGARDYLKPTVSLFVSAPNVSIDLIRKYWIAVDNMIRKSGEYDDV